jgi:hypothetical protein
VKIVIAEIKNACVPNRNDAMMADTVDPRNNAIALCGHKKVNDTIHPS